MYPEGDLVLRLHWWHRRDTHLNLVVDGGRFTRLKEKGGEIESERDCIYDIMYTTGCLLQELLHTYMALYILYGNHFNQTLTYSMYTYTVVP